MRTPVSVQGKTPLRGDYADARADYSIDQDWAGYTPAMHDRWRRLYARQHRLIARHGASQFLAGLDRLDMGAAIPRFDRANALLGAATGWRIVGVPGLIPDDAFFGHLAAREFPVTCWLREEDELDYLVEPDIFHDYFGHVPMLLIPAFADFMAAYGEAGSRAIAMDALPMLARIYWYSVEFGLIDQGDGLKAFGAGLLSSAGETLHSIEDDNVLRLCFDPVRIMRTAYHIDRFQACYFVLDSFDTLIAELVALDFGPIYERWRDIEPIPAGRLQPGDRLYRQGTACR